MNNALSKISYLKQSSFVLVKNIRNHSSQNNKTQQQKQYEKQNEQETQQQKQEPHCEKKDNFDVIINGGGIVGFSLLASLQSSPFFKEKKVLLFEQQAKTNSSVKKADVQGERQLSNRVSSLTTSSKKFFQNIGVWNDVKEFTKPIKQMYVWGNNFKNGIAFTPNGHDENDVICYVTENNRILDSLKTIIDKLGHSVCYGTGVVDVKGEENYVDVTTNCSNNDYVNEMKTSLLIGCDGFNSIVRQKSDLKVFEHDLAQCGIVGTVTVSSDQSNLNNEIAWQRFVPFDRSVLALLPLTSECCSFVWSTSLRRANELMELSDERFVDEMNEALFVESNQDSTLAVACDKLLNSLLSSKLLPPIQHPVVSTPQILFLDPGSRASFPLKFSTTMPYLVGSPHGFKNNRVVIIGKFISIKLKFNLYLLLF